MPRSTEGVIVLAYHLVDGGTASPVDVSLDVFLEQMNEARSLGRVVRLDEALRMLAAGEPLTEPVIVVTFDDAFANFADRVWPALAEHEIPATLYAPVDFIDGRAGSPLAGADLGPCSWSQLREMAAHGLVEIGSHTCSHRTLTTLPVEEATREIERSRERLEGELGARVDSFCYPRGKWSVALERTVRRSYASAAVGGGRQLRPSAYSPYRLTRFPVRRDMPRSLRPLLERSVLLEEALADAIRRRAA